MTTRLRLVCHASTAALRTGAFPDDEPLDGIDLKKLAGANFGLRGSDRCWTSPARRAVQTAQALRDAQAFDVEATTDPRLGECDYGRWTGQSLEGVHRQEPDALAEWLRNPEVAPHGGESLVAMMQRVAAWLDAQATLGRKIVAVTHASVIRAAVLHAIGAPPTSFWRIDIAPLSVTRLTESGGRWTLTSTNHLPAKQLSV